MRLGAFRLAAAIMAVAVASPVAATTPAWAPFAKLGPRADGVWRSVGYGHLLSVRRGRARLFHHAGRYCYPDPVQPPGDAQDFRVGRIDRHGRLVLAATPERTRYVFRRVAALPSACTVRRRWSADTVTRVVAATFSDLYAGFGARGRDRRALVRALTATPVASPAMLYDRLAGALAGLDDAHVGLDARINGQVRGFEGGEAATLRAAAADPRLGADPAARLRQWGADYREGITALLDGGGHLVANRRVLWGRIGRVGYLNVLTMGAFDADAAPDDTTALDAALDDAIADFRGLPGVIVDVTNNRGGYDPVALRIAGRFADRRRLAFAKAPTGVPGSGQRFHVVPSRRARYVGPVAVLTGDITVSAGEVFVLAMRALPNVRQLGARTRGALSDQLAKPLPNGWTLTLPAETYRDPAGRSAEGCGIDPDRPLPPFAPDHRAVLAALAAEMAGSGVVSDRPDTPPFVRSAVEALRPKCASTALGANG